jgi:LytS/YehU family sensor histidine kinase
MVAVENFIWMDNPSNNVNSTKLAIIAILAALSIGTNYAMISLSNVKLMDFIVFIGGFCFGPFVGALIGVVSWIVYGSLNPLGFSLPIWFSTMFSEAIYGVAGALVKKSLNSERVRAFKYEQFGVGIYFGIVGTFLTLIYDLITNIVFGYVSGWNILFAIIVGFVPFGFVHMISNAFFFGLGCIPAINAISKLVGGENSGVSKK